MGSRIPSDSEGVNLISYFLSFLVTNISSAVFASFSLGVLNGPADNIKTQSQRYQLSFRASIKGMLLEAKKSSRPLRAAAKIFCKGSLTNGVWCGFLIGIAQVRSM